MCQNVFPLKLDNSYKFHFYFNIDIEIDNWWCHEMSLDEVHWAALLLKFKMIFKYNNWYHS
jgi:hypothetical protein